jgi:oligosaccharide repeat unit polymerase
MLKNPFLLYILVFGGVLATYQLQWSEIYPDLSLETLVFFCATFILATGFAFVVSRDVKETAEYRPVRLPRYTALFLVAVYVADFAYADYIPLLSLIQGNYQYGSFPGIPTVHVFAATFGGAFSTIRFADFLYSKTKRFRYLLEAILPLVFIALLTYRGWIMVTLTSWGFVYIIKRGRLGFARALLIPALLLGGLYAFGAFGDVRTGGIEELGRPSQAFRESGVPRTYFWGYLYATSPLANLQYAIDLGNPRSDLQSFVELVISEMLPDFLSNRLLPLLQAQRVSTPEIGPGLNVATVFGRSYVYFGWTGLVLMFAWLLTVVTAYLVIIRNSPYRVPCLALLNTLVVFCSFDNMIAQTSVSFQLIWPLLLIPALASLKKFENRIAARLSRLRRRWKRRFARGEMAGPETASGS